MASNEYLEKAQEFCRKTNTGITVNFVKNDMECPWDVGKCHAKYAVVISRKVSGIKKRMTLDFWESIVGTQNNEVPDEYDILACLDKYDPGNYEEFCHEFGYEIYDPDGMYYNPESKRVYKGVRHCYMQVVRLFSDVIDDLREIY